MSTLVLVGVAGNSMVEGAGFSIPDRSASYLDISEAISRQFRLDALWNAEGKDRAVANMTASSQMFTSPLEERQKARERNWSLARLLGQKHAMALMGSDLLRNLAAESILPKHNFDMQLGGGGINPGGMQGMFSQAGSPGVMIVPYISVAERYDSNVFFAPQIQGLKRQDYVTSVSPGIMFLDNSHVVRTALQVGAIGEYFVNNPGLSYVGVNGVLSFRMDQLVRRVVPGATFLVAQSVSYSPVIPGFQSGVTGSSAQSLLADDEQPDTTTALVRSQQLYRANSLVLNSTVAGSMPITSSVMFQANYGYSRFQFGSPAVNEATGANIAQTINSTAHSVQAGPAWRITSSDTLGLRAIYEKADYGGDQGGYDAVGGSLGWQRRISQSFNFRVYAGATSVEQSFGASLGQQSASTQGVGYTGGISTVYVSGPQTVQLTFQSGISPSFVAAVGSMQTNIAQIIVFRRLENALSISGGGTYNHSESMNGNTSLAGTFFESYSGFAGVGYHFSPKVLATLSYTAGTYHGNYFTSEIQSFGRQAVTFTISSYWF